MEAFAQFGTELDKATVQQLERGKRLVELLKQAQYKPMSVQEQIISILAGVGGYTDNIEVEEVARFEEELLKYIKENYAGLLSEIETKKELSTDLRDRLNGALAEFRGKFISKVKI